MTIPNPSLPPALFSLIQSHLLFADLESVIIRSICLPKRYMWSGTRREFLKASAGLAVDLLFLQKEEALLKEFLQDTRPLYFEKTGHHILGRFQVYWRQDGNGLTVGLPITEAFRQDGKTIQYFENARLEWFPEHKGTPWEVQLGLLGQEIRPDLVPNRELPPLNPYFVQKYGGWDFLGYPLSEPTREGNATSQLTQRFRIVEHDRISVLEGLEGAYRKYKEYKEIRGVRGLLWPGEIKLEPLGGLVAEKYGIDTKPVGPSTDAVLYTSSLMNREKRIEVEKSGFSLKAYEGDLVVFSALISTARPGFTTPVGEFRVLNKIPSMVYDSRGVFPPGVATYYFTDVPFNLQVVENILIHGAYWHDGFGKRNLSAGCINLNLDDAWWIYKWAQEGIMVIVAA